MDFETRLILGDFQDCPNAPQLPLEVDFVLRLISFWADFRIALMPPNFLFRILGLRAAQEPPKATQEPPKRHPEPPKRRPRAAQPRLLPHLATPFRPRRV